MPNIVVSGKEAAEILKVSGRKLCVYRAIECLVHGETKDQMFGVVVEDQKGNVLSVVLDEECLTRLRSGIDAAILQMTIKGEKT